MFKVGDYVKIKDGTTLDSGDILNNWQGTVTSIVQDDIYLVMLDSITINSFSDEYLIEHVEDEFDQEPFELFLQSDELEISERRDSDKEMKKALDNLSKRIIKIERESEERMEVLKQKWIREFQESDHFNKLDDYQKENAGFTIDGFMSFIKNYEYVNPKDWDKENVTAVCLEVLPRKVTAENEFFENLGDILIYFFTFLGVNNYVDNSKELVRAIKKIKNDIPRMANNSDNWGMAKAMMMQAQDSGFDISDEADLENFMRSYNESLNYENNETKVIPLKPDLYKGIGRNQKIRVKYTSGKIVADTKFKKVESDLRNGLCEIIPE